ncbi:transmembrane 9 superfamily member 4-like [Actinia tenebrosa]|uniref:Transmembrane 9 superfamily member n=1 Tax=Actinia tenebrosa TaxID=6105 RepID=A0A6P8HST3_ACTTE|nr:transmembrane 9 superfamily member 4-like [Actinia tenebrosa]
MAESEGCFSRMGIFMKILYICLIWLLMCQYSMAFYLPGIAPIDYEKGQKLEVKAVKMTSVKTQLPYEYYTLPFCKPQKLDFKPENLGEVLRGDRIVNTPYEVAMNVNKKCTVLCEPIELTDEMVDTLTKRIEKEYFIHMVLDNLPAATKLYILNNGETHYDHGYRLGFILDDKKVLINNHLKMIFKYHTYDNITYRVVGFEVQPRSYEFNSLDIDKNTCSLKSETPAGQEIKKNAKVRFTYEVEWQSSNIVWASRWDTYLAMSDVQIHWFSIVNSVVIVLFLSGIVAMIMIRTLRSDIARYNKEDDYEDTVEETGWKLVHGDVFRPPQKPWLLTAFIGSGVQIFCMVLITLVFAMLGMLSPASRGSLVQAIILLYVFMGVFAGYHAGRLYKTLKGVNWKKSTVVTAALYPGFVSAICFFLNFFIWGKHSSGAVPFTTMIALLCLWVGVSLPLVFLGYYFGYRKYPYEHPVRTNQIPRQVPEQMWYMKKFVGSLVTLIQGFLSMFSVYLWFNHNHVLIVLFQAIWENQFYYLFGFLFLVFVILAICVSQISIVITYFQLVSEDYHWWWKSFLMSGSCSFYVFLYAVFYFVTKLQIVDFIPALLYFGYTLIMVFSFWLLTGTIGFYSTYFFVRHIYSAVKID